jgi:hypothetical protein
MSFAQQIVRRSRSALEPGSRNNEYGDWNKKESDAQVLAFITPLGKLGCGPWRLKSAKASCQAKTRT